jgi:hypothetical protein
MRMLSAAGNWVFSRLGEEGAAGMAGFTLLGVGFTVIGAGAGAGANLYQDYRTSTRRRRRTTMSVR